MYGSPIKIWDPKAVRQMRLICHPKIRKAIGAWSFKGEEDNSQENEKSRCLVTDVCPAMQGSLSIKKSYLL